MKTLPSPSDRLFQTAPQASTWSPTDDREAAAIRAADAFAARRVAKIAATPRQSYRKTGGENFEMQLSKMLLSFNPPRFKNDKEQKMCLPMLVCKAGAFEFKIVRNTDPATALRFSRIVAERCGDAAAAEFETAAKKVVKQRAAAPVAPTAPRVDPWSIPASGKDCRRGDNTASRKRFITSPRDLARLAEEEAMKTAKAIKWEKEMIRLCFGEA
jgi:hypothetical protein